MAVGVLVLLDRHVASSYADATMAALGHATRYLGAHIPVVELPTASIDASTVSDFGAIVVGPGSPYDNPDGVLTVIRSARERGLPLVGT